MRHSAPREQAQPCHFPRSSSNAMLDAKADEEVPSLMVWQIDPAHTQVEFSVKHLGMMTVHGHFRDISTAGSIAIVRSLNR